MAHPLLTDTVLLHARLGLRRKGFSRAQINSVMDGVTNETVQNLADAIGVTFPQPPEAGDDPVPPAPVPTPHPILDWLKTLIASPGFQALVAALIQMLIHALIP